MFTKEQIDEKSFKYIVATIDPMYVEGFKSWYESKTFNSVYERKFNQTVELFTELFVDS